MTDRNLTMGLTDYDRQLITEAREVAGLSTAALSAHTGEDDTGMAYAVAFGRAQQRLVDLLRLMERLAELETAKAEAR
jgi:ribosome-binding protein aMBF1 (putative translation factor)